MDGGHLDQWSMCPDRPSGPCQPLIHGFPPQLTQLHRIHHDALFGNYSLLLLRKVLCNTLMTTTTESNNNKKEEVSFTGSVVHK